MSRMVFNWIWFGNDNYKVFSRSKCILFQMLVFTLLRTDVSAQNSRPAQILTPIQQVLPILIDEYQDMPKLATQARVMKLNELLELWFNFATQLKGCREKCGSVTWKSASANRADQYWHPLISVHCFAKCANVTDSLLQLNLTVLKDMIIGKHYYQMHNVHFESEEYEMAVGCAYSYWLRNPKSNSNQIVKRYLGAQQHIRDVEPAAYLRLYFDGVLAYNEKDWTRTSKKMEAAKHLYYSEFEACSATCEFLAFFVDHQLTDFRVDSESFLSDNESIANQPIGQSDESDNSEDTYLGGDAFRRAVRYLAECISTCRHRLDNDGYDTRNGPYHPQIYHYLQYAYYQMGELQRAASAAQSYLTLLPQDQVMIDNKQCYLHTADPTHNCYVADDAKRVTLSETNFVPDLRVVKYAETAQFVDAVLEAYAPLGTSNSESSDMHDEL